MAVVKTTDPWNPIIVDTIPTPMAQDVRIVGNTLYAIDWPNRNGNYFWVVPLKSEWPYYDEANMVGIPFDDESVDTVESCDVIPLQSGHTLFSTENYLFMPELGTDDGSPWEIAVFDISTNPMAPRLIKLWDLNSLISDPFDRPHSVYCIGDTVYNFMFWGAIYKGMFDPGGPLDDFTSQGRIWYDPFRNDLTDQRQMDSIYCPEQNVTNLKRPLSHSGWLSLDGNYILACDEADNGCPSWGAFMGGFLRVFEQNGAI